VPGPYADPRAAALLERYRAAFGGPDVPVPVEAIAEDLLGLRVRDAEGLACSGLLIPARREILVSAEEAAQSPGRRRFTIAHELGHWVCQVLEGHPAPVFCRRVSPAPEAAAPSPGVTAGLDPRSAGGRPGPTAAPSGERPATADDRALEREANVFAAELLMPVPAVRAVFGAAASVATTAESFGVSAEAMHWRLYNAGLVPDPPRTPES
jgi:hypothetical protein